MILKASAGKRRVVGVAARDRLVGAHLDALDRRHVDRRRQVVDDGVEQRLHALVLERRAAQHRNEARRRSCPCGCSLDQRLVVGLLAGEILLERASSCSTAISTSLCAVLGGLLLACRPGSRRSSNFGAQRLVLPDDRLDRDQVDDAREVGLERRSAAGSPAAWRRGDR